MKQIFFTSLSISIATLFWLFDSLIHYFIYGEVQLEIIPEDFNELWMRTVIIILLISFGIFADLFSKKLLTKEKQLEALKIYNSMTFATHHILNNLLNQMQLFRMEAQNSKDFNQDIIKQYDDAIKEASNLLSKLSDIESITDTNILASIDPNNKDTTPLTNNIKYASNK
ncbi:MAG: hypothetical protein OQK76_00985 [Gammaproteobacteria bacterium]|nr:hypothetical protein [Gammaproteobacteria bacterium]MCW8909170.1 hypothetical protein [Gammaproteobacteria bacterium]MCW9005696.1 hypothetical protein [Gammaproteobacteria bacterium]MCW9055267.1 hypothetical protein [Gammaproteobacteria bacterium]